MIAGEAAARLRVGIVASEPIRLAGLAAIFEGSSDYVPVTGPVQALVADRNVACLLLDLNSNRRQQLDAFVLIRRQRADLRTIVLGPEGDDLLVVHAIQSGARGYLSTSVDPGQILYAIHEVMAGSIWAPRRLLSQVIDRLTAGARDPETLETRFTERERQVLELILNARSNREIGSALGIDERTVKKYVTSLMSKAGVESRLALSVQAMRGRLRRA